MPIKNSVRKLSLFTFLCLVFMSGCGGGGGGGGSSPTKTPTPTPTPAASATTSGGLATINTGSAVVSFIPSGAGVIIVPVSGAGAAKASLDVTRSAAAALSISFSFTADSCTADGTDLKVICVGYNSSKVAIVDIAAYVASGATPTVSEFDPGNTVDASFSGGGCLNCGVLADQGDHRFIVSSGDGYRVFDYSGKLLQSFLSDASATPPIDLVTENFGYDPVHNLIISPEYESANNYLWVVNLDSGKVYRWTKKIVGTTLDPNGLPELGSSSFFVADAAAVDPVTGVLTIGNEFTPLILALNLNAATFNDTAGTFDAPYTVAPLQNVYGSILTTGMAVEPANHLLFLEEEFANTIGLVVLPAAAATGSVAITEYISAQIPDPSATCANTFGWFNVGDPHGLALFTSVVDSKPKGLLIDGTKTCMAIIDLDSLRSAPRSTGTNEVDPAYDLLTNKVVSFISLQ